MFSVQTLIVAALLAELGLVVESSCWEGARSSSFDLSSASDQSRLHNSPVHRAVRTRRPLGSTSFLLGPLSHSAEKSVSVPSNSSHVSSWSQWSTFSLDPMVRLAVPTTACS
ncbi:uncharacterized protein LOC115545544 [Gadus morhua]|uniref:uncharacterized protein LOC115545544 n=1 Tax=Gadus morhua TaxID=8049 RepID=UPI0011B792E1|nr:uncharacterized protein LOC115545544 [Gadus morhua]